MTLSERMYRLMLRAYPARYREKYAEPMACCFRDQLRQARTASAFRRLWADPGRIVEEYRRRFDLVA